MATRFTGSQSRSTSQPVNFISDPGFNFIDPGFFQPQPPLPAPPAPAAAPAPATGPSVNLQALLASIPIASDGQVITADHHNSLRAAVIGIANQLGVGLQTATTTYTFAPAFIQTGVASSPPNWSVVNFAASRPAGGSADGWLPVQLPNGQRIQSMMVTGRRGGATPPTLFEVHLFRQLFTAAATDAPTLLIKVSLESASSQFQVSAGVVPAAAPTGSGLSLITAAAAEEQKLIDTSIYKYFVQAVLTAPATDSTAEIDAIQIVCGQ
jgi:hypothetical protein